MGNHEIHEPLSLIYKYLDDGTPAHVSVYPPTITDVGPSAVPAIVYFHGGGLCTGDRNSWHPAWLQRRANARGFAFLSADYRLVPPATGHAIVEDIKDLFAFLGKEDLYTAICSRYPASVAEAYKFGINKEAIIVAGSSAGGLCAYLAAIHCTLPKPKAVLSMYGSGGHFFTPHYLIPKKAVFFRGRELLDPTDFAEFLYPFPHGLKEIAGSPLAYHPSDHPIPGYPANPRMFLGRLYLQLGVQLDYYTGRYSPSLSEALRPLLSIHPNWDGPDGHDGLAFKEVIPEELHYLIPQFHISANWPRTILCHGTADSAIHVIESQLLAESLAKAGVNVKLFEFEGKEHSFDYEADAEEKHGKVFDKILEILQEWVIN